VRSSGARCCIPSTVGRCHAVMRRRSAMSSPNIARSRVVPVRYGTQRDSVKNQFCQRLPVWRVRDPGRRTRANWLLLPSRLESQRAATVCRGIGESAVSVHVEDVGWYWSDQHPARRRSSAPHATNRPLSAPTQLPARLPLYIHDSYRLFSIYPENRCPTQQLTAIELQ
jgi:hypothetical protein